MTQASRLDSMRAEFLRRSIDDLTALSKILSDDEQLPPIHQLVSVIHKIAGTGYSLEFNELAQEAKTLETHWRTLPPSLSEDRVMLNTQVRTLLERCRAE